MKSTFKNYYWLKILLLFIIFTSFSISYGKLTNSAAYNDIETKDHLSGPEYKFIAKVKSLDSLLLKEKIFYEGIDSEIKKKIDSAVRNYESMAEYTSNNYRHLSIDNEENSISKKLIDNIGYISKTFKTLPGDSLKIVNYSLEIGRKKAEILKELRLLSSQLSGSVEFELSEGKYTVFIADKKNHDISLYYKHPSSEKFLTIDRLLTYLEKVGKKTLMITNAGMFHKDFTPVGLCIDEMYGIQKPLDTSKVLLNDNFHMYPNGVFCIDTMGKYQVLTTSAFQKKYSDKLGIFKVATQSGPMLVIDSIIHNKFSPRSANIQIRSGVGVAKDSKKVVFLATSKPESFYNFSLLFRDIFSCNDALYLDGAISKMYIPGRPKYEYSGNFGPMIAVTDRKLSK